MLSYLENTGSLARNLSLWTVISNEIRELAREIRLVEKGNKFYMFLYKFCNGVCSECSITMLMLDITKPLYSN